MITTSGPNVKAKKRLARSPIWEAGRFAEGAAGSESREAEMRSGGAHPVPATSLMRAITVSASYAAGSPQNSAFDIDTHRRGLRPPLTDRGQDIRHHFRLRLGAEAAFAVDAD